MFACERCGREAAPDARFCASCGAPLSAAEAAREERKAVSALFADPVAHEDDPERAVRAALAVRTAITALNEEEPGRDLHVRIAVCTGEALVTVGARPSEGEGMAAGDVVNTAARLQSAAPVDGILVDTVTHRATERAIEYRDAPAVEAKGKAEPIPVWEAVEARSRYGVDLAGPGRGGLVGG